MTATARQGRKCRTPTTAEDARLAQDFDGWWRASYASDASSVGRKTLGGDKWRADHAGGSGAYVPRVSDYGRLALRGLSRARIIALCDDLKARLLAVATDTGASFEPIHLCTSRVARETGEAVAALVLAVGDGASPEARIAARREVAEARVELERAQLALCGPALRRGRVD